MSVFLPYTLYFVFIFETFGSLSRMFQFCFKKQLDQKCMMLQGIGFAWKLMIHCINSIKMTNLIKTGVFIYVVWNVLKLFFNYMFKIICNHVNQKEKQILHIKLYMKWKMTWFLWCLIQNQSLLLFLFLACRENRLSTMSNTEAKSKINLYKISYLNYLLRQIMSCIC